MWPLISVSCFSFLSFIVWVSIHWSVRILHVRPLCLSQCNSPPLQFLALSPHPVLFNSFQHISLCLIPYRCDVFYYYSLSFFSSSLHLLYHSHFWIHALYIFHAYIILLIFVLGPYSTHERKCGLWLSQPGLLHLNWCSPVPFIYLQMTKVYSSLWLNKIPLHTHTTFS
jgi:hypothetical protein